MTALSALTITCVFGGAQHAADPMEDSIRHLRSAVTSQRDGSHLGMLLALRQLRDSQLEPVFEQLLDHDEWQIQVNAALGLAELAPTPQVNPDHMARLSPLAQEAAIATALDLELLDPQQIPAFLSSDGLSPMAQLFLWAEVIAADGDVDREELRPLVEHDEYRISCLAALLLAELGEESFLGELRAKLDEEGRAGRRQLLWMLDAVRQYNLSSAQPWIRSILEKGEAHPDVADTAILSAVSLDPAANIDLWEKGLGREPSLSRRVRFGLMLLHAGPDVPAQAYDSIEGDEDLSIRIAEAGRAVSRGVHASSAIAALIDYGHVRSLEWAVGSGADSLSDEEAARVYLHVLDRLEASFRDRDPRQPAPRAEWVAAGVTAASKLFKLDPQRALQRLLDSDPESPSREALLIGALEAGSAEAGEVAATLDGTGFGRAESLSLLLHAKHAASLSKQDRTRLGLLAAGGGRLSTELQAQAAWLYIKHADAVPAACQRLLAASAE